jgi:transposase-like protein
LELECAAVWVSIAPSGGTFHEQRDPKAFHPQQKAQIVRRHLAGKEAVSDLADEFGIQPSQIHGWVKQVLDQAEAAFQRQPVSRRLTQVKDEKIAQLEEKLVQKNEVIAELMEENVRAKKANGEL